MEGASAAFLLASHLAVLSLVSIGGAHTVLPDVYRYVVSEHGWMTGAQFSALVAIAQAAPGPNLLVVTLFGYQVAGPWSAALATVAFCAPSSFVTYGVARFGARGGDAPWKRWLKRGFAPITVGLIVASGLILTRNNGAGAIGIAIALTTATLTLTTRAHPLWFIFGGATVAILTG